jgi:hypothetical protein
MAYSICGFEVQVWQLIFLSSGIYVFNYHHFHNYTSFDHDIGLMR